MSADRNELARWEIPDNLSPFWDMFSPKALAMLNPEMNYWVLAPMRCPECETGWFYMQPVTINMPDEEARVHLNARREEIRQRGWLCDNCQKRRAA